MKAPPDISTVTVDKLAKRFFKEAKAGSYHMNPDVVVTVGLVMGLLIYEAR